MTIKDFISNYKLHDSLVENITQNTETSELILSIDFCYWMQGNYNNEEPMITVELCPYVGNYPYPNSDFDTVWKPAKNILLAVGNEIIYLNK